MSTTSLRPFVAEDLYLYRSVSELRSSPRGDCIVFPLKGVDREKDGYTSSLWLAPLDGGPLRQLTTAGAQETSPRFFHDGSRIAFLSDRNGGSPQVFVLPMDGGEARQVTTLPNGVSSFAISPDGRRLLVVAFNRVDPNARGAEDDRPPEGKAPEIAWRVPYKMDGIGYVLDRRWQLFVVDIDGGEPTQLTNGPIEVRSGDWSPDGKRIAFARTRAGRQAQGTDIWITNADGSEQRQLTTDIATTFMPKWSPDGRTIVFGGSAEEGDAQVRLWTVDVASGRVSALGPDWLESVSGDAVAWSDDSTRITLLNARNGRQEIARIDVASGEVQSVVRSEDRQVVALSCARGHLAYVSRRLTEPCEIYVADADGGAEKRVSDFNGWWRERRQPRVELRRFDVPDGDGGRVGMDGWLVLPPDAGSGPLPLLLDVHGGPQTYVDIDYMRDVHWSMLWSRGFAILATNGFGSSSYGRAFADAVRGHWGERCLPQHLSAIDALQREGRVDQRLAVAGKSYGGFLAAWAIGHTDRFKAAVVSAPVGSLESHYGTSDGGYYLMRYAIGVEPWEDPERVRRLSPLQHMHRVTTPTLFLQGKDDQRCPVGQSEELFARVMRATETPAELVLYPGESHHLAEAGSPSFRVDYFNRIVEWIERWTGNAPAKDRSSSDERGEKTRRAVEQPVAAENGSD